MTLIADKRLFVTISAVISPACPHLKSCASRAGFSHSCVIFLHLFNLSDKTSFEDFLLCVCFPFSLFFRCEWNASRFELILWPKLLSIIKLHCVEIWLIVSCICEINSTNIDNIMKTSIWTRYEDIFYLKTFLVQFLTNSVLIKWSLTNCSENEFASERCDILYLINYSKFVKIEKEIYGVFLL